MFEHLWRPMHVPSEGTLGVQIYRVSVSELWACRTIESLSANFGRAGLSCHCQRTLGVQDYRVTVTELESR